MKKIMIIMASTVLSFALLSCGGNSHSPKALKLSFAQSSDHPQYKAMVEFAKNINERTNGEYTIELYPNELLGAQKETIELLQSGIVHMAVVSNGMIENFNPDFTVFNLPYVFEGKEHQVAVINDPAIVGDLYRSMNNTGIHILGGYHAGTRSLYTKRPVREPSDLAGMKIRVMESTAMLEMMRRMGGTPTPLSMGEVYTAIQQGVIDGAENNEITYVQSKNSEVAPYFSYTNHMMVPDFLIINSRIFDKMDEETRIIFEEEFAKSAELELEYWAEDTQALIEWAKDQGVTFIDVDVNAFKERVIPLHDELIKTESAKTLYTNVRAVAQ